MVERGLPEAGKKAVVVDHAAVGDPFRSAVVGQQIARESREVGMVLGVDVHLLSRLGRDQDRQQQAGVESGEYGASSFGGQKYI